MAAQKPRILCAMCSKPTEFVRQPRTTAIPRTCSDECSEAQWAARSILCPGGCGMRRTEARGWDDPADPCYECATLFGEQRGQVRRLNADAFLARLSDVLRRSGVEDAERMIGRVETLVRRARESEVFAHHCGEGSEALAMHIAEQAIENEPTVTGAPADWEG